MLPTFGPTWINFYGTPRQFKLVEELSALNEGIGEGTAYRGRLLLQVKTELLDSEESMSSSVHREIIKTSTKVKFNIKFVKHYNVL